MYPVLFTINWMGKDVPVGTYGVLMIVAFLAAGALTLYVARCFGYRPENFINHCLLVFAGTIGGALLAGFLVFLPERMGRGFIDYPPALVSWGGMLGGLAALGYIAFSWKERFLLLADIFTPGYLLGQGIGRIGCFFAGCCYGVPTGSCLGITFTDLYAPASAAAQPLVPVQLISAAFLAAAGVISIPFVLKKKISGAVFGAAAMAHAAFRFIIEFWRDDPRLFVSGLSDGQIFSIIYFIFGLGIVVYSARR